MTSTGRAADAFRPVAAQLIIDVVQMWWPVPTLALLASGSATRAQPIQAAMLIERP